MSPVRPTDAAPARVPSHLHPLDPFDLSSREQFDRLARVAASLLDVPIARVVLVDGADLIVIGAAGESEGDVERSVLREDGPVRHTLAAGIPLLVPAPRSDAAAAEASEAVADGVGCFAGAPLIAGGETLGVVAAFGPGPRAWPADAVDLLRDVAALCVAQIEREALRQFHRHLGSASPVIAFRDGSRNFCTDYVTPNLTSVLGYAPEEVVGVPDWWPGRLHPDDRDRALGRQAAALAERQPSLEHEFRMRHRDGGYRWLRSYTRFDYEPDGGVGSIWGFMLDVTERREAEIERDLAMEELRAMIHNSPDLLARFDRNLRHTFVNARVEEVVGRPAAEIVGRTNREMGFDGETAHLWDVAIEEVFRTGEARDIEFSVAGPGGVRWYQSRLVPEHDAGGGVGSVLGVTRDITQSREAAAQLRYQLELTSTVTTNVAEGLCFMDGEGRLTYMNPAAEEILGWRQEELAGEVLHERVHYLRPDGSRYPVEQCPLNTVLAGGAVIRDREDVWIRKGGEFFPVFCSCTPIRREGAVVGAVISLHDISDRKRAEAERELLLEREREVRAEAERANRVKAEFLAVMSHELRTPLTAILGYAELLQLGIPVEIPAEARSQIDRIDSAARHLLQLIEEILAFSRIEAGREQIRVEPVDLGSVAEEAAEFIRPLAERGGLTLVLDIPPEAASIPSDRGKVRQVLVNLLSNAVKFTAAGKVTLRLRTSAGVHRLEVHDTGPGIAEADLERIFLPFHQLDQGNTRSASGTGLGLAISRRLATLLGAELTVSSEPGAGSVFHFVLSASGAPEGGSAGESEAPPA